MASFCTPVINFCFCCYLQQNKRSTPILGESFFTSIHQCAWSYLLLFPWVLILSLSLLSSSMPYVFFKPLTLLQNTKKTKKKPSLGCVLSSPIDLSTLGCPLSSQLAYWSHLSQTLSLFTPQYSSANNCSRFFPNISLKLCSLRPVTSSQQSFPVIAFQSSPSLTSLEDVVLSTSSALFILSFLTVLCSLWPLFFNLCYLSSSAPCFMLDSRAGPYLSPILSLLSPLGCDFIHSSAFC